MIYTKEFENLLSSAKSIQGMSQNECSAYFEKMESLARALVQVKITGERKGLPGEYNYMHSMRVYEAIKRLHSSENPDIEFYLAALLHDIVEDGGVSFEELVALGFTGRTIELIRLCTHDMSVENKTERWVLMVARLIEARNKEAWFIKLCDLADNLAQCHGLSEDNRTFMVEVKAPLLLRLTEWIDGDGEVYFTHLKDRLDEVTK